MRTVLRIFGFAALIISGVLLVSPVLTMFIPACPHPPQYFYPVGIGAGLLAVFVFAILEGLERG